MKVETEKLGTSGATIKLIIMVIWYLFAMGAISTALYIAHKAVQLL